MTLPGSVKVGASVYRIEEWGARDANRVNLLGDVDHTRCVIRVDVSYGPHQAAKTLLHEIIHAVWIEWRLCTDTPSEERVVESMERGLSAVWRDSPDVMRWIGKRLTEETPAS